MELQTQSILVDLACGIGGSVVSRREVSGEAFFGGGSGWYRPR